MGPHGTRMCNTFKLLKGGSFQCPFPPKSKRSQGAGNTTNLTQTDPKALRKQYHNPHPIACLVGQVNEECVLINDVQSLALVDSGAQIFTITIEFVKQLGLEVHSLDRILKFETTGGDIPYMGYVKVDLKIPEIKACNKHMPMFVIEDSAYAQCIPIQLGTLHIDMALDLISDKEIMQLSTKWK